MSKTRREFAKSLAIAGAIAPFVTADAVAQAPAQPDAKPSPLADALTQVVKASYGQHLSAEDLEKIGKDFRDYAPMVENFRKVKLTNADEPDFTFHSLAERW